MIITNEKKYIEEILSSGEKPTNISVKSLIRYLARYYYDYCKEQSVDEYKRFVLDAVGSFNLSPLQYQEYRYANYARTYCKNLLDGVFPSSLRETESITITEAELSLVNEAVYRKERKVLFTIYALAKVYSPTLGWINCSETDIFKCANVEVSYKERLQIMHSLIKDGLVEMNHMLDKNGYHVELFPDSPVIFSTDKLENFGNQYLVLMNDNLKICPKCGRVYRKVNDAGICSKCSL